MVVEPVRSLVLRGTHGIPKLNGGNAGVKHESIDGTARQASLMPRVRKRGETSGGGKPIGPIGSNLHILICNGMF